MHFSLSDQRAAEMNYEFWFLSVLHECGMSAAYDECIQFNVSALLAVYLYLWNVIATIVRIQAYFLISGFSCDFYRARKIQTELVSFIMDFIIWRVFFSSSSSSIPSSAHDGRENDKESVCERERECRYRVTFAFHHILHFSTWSRFGTFISVRCGNLTSLHRF